jgi:hypothetical protein
MTWLCKNVEDSRGHAIKDSSSRSSRIFRARTAFCLNQSCAGRTTKIVFAQPRPNPDIDVTAVPELGTFSDRKRY